MRCVQFVTSVSGRFSSLSAERIATKLNLEMAAADEVVAFACKVHPEDCCLVPERRAELTTEGADAQIDHLAKKYLGQDEYPFRNPEEQRITVKIRPEKVDASGFDE